MAHAQALTGPSHGASELHPWIYELLESTGRRTTGGQRKERRWGRRMGNDKEAVRGTQLPMSLSMGPGKGVELAQLLVRAELPLLEPSYPVTLSDGGAPARTSRGPPPVGRTSRGTPLAERTSNGSERE